MNKGVVVGALVVAAFVAAVVYLAPGSADKPAATSDAATSRTDAGAADTTAPSAVPQSSGPSPAAAASGQPGAATHAPSDPRLIALAVSQDNGLIEFVRGTDGRVIAEIDKDPSSPSFRKPTREYLYSGDRVTGLTAYRYFADHTEISRTAVAYKTDGSVDRIVEDTRFEPTKKK